MQIHRGFWLRKKEKNEKKTTTKQKQIEFFIFFDLVVRLRNSLTWPTIYLSIDGSFLSLIFFVIFNMDRYFRNLMVYEMAWVKNQFNLLFVFFCLSNDRFIQNLVVC